MTIAMGEPERPSSAIGDHPASYWFKAAYPSVGDIVEVRVGPQVYFRAEVETVAPHAEVLWVAGSAFFPRTLFLRQEGPNIWTSHRY